MSATFNAVNYIIELGPVILLPVILFMISLIITRKPLKNLKNFAFIFTGLFGVSVLLGLFINFFTPFTNTIILNSTKEYTIIDAGWLVSKNVILNSPITLYIIIAVVSINIIMLLFRFTRTINIDIWNYWSFLFIGSIIFAITGMEWIALLIAIIAAAITLVLSDIYAIYINNYYGISGFSTPQAHVICWAPLSHLINTIFNKIPLIRRIHIFYEELQYKMGIFSEPILTGFILGFIIGAITRYKNFFLNPASNLFYAFISGLTLSFIFILVPRTVNILFKGLTPTISDIKSFIKRKITKRDLNIGLDPIILAGMPSTITMSAVLIPLTIYISTILPGSTILPSSDLIMIPLIMVWVIVLSRGDIFRSFISAIIIIPIILWISSNMGNLFTNFFLKYDIEMIEGYRRVSSMGGSSNVLFWILLKIIEPIFSLHP